MKWAVLISSHDAETIHNALRLADTAQKRGSEVSLFMLGRAVEYEDLSSEQFDLAGQVTAFQEKGDFYVWGVCLTSRGREGLPSCPMAFMDHLYEIISEADKVVTF